MMGQRGKMKVKRRRGKNGVGWKEGESVGIEETGKSQSLLILPEK